MRNDPNGQPWLDWKKYGYSSHEAFIESKAGDSPPERKPLARRTGGTTRAEMAGLFRADPHDDSISDFPMPKPPPFAADDEDDPAPRGDADES
jgi:hypothetical protein